MPIQRSGESRGFLKFALKSFGASCGNGGDALECFVVQGDAAVLLAPFVRGNSAHGNFPGSNPLLFTNIVHQQCTEGPFVVL